MRAVHRFDCVTLRDLSKSKFILAVPVRFDEYDKRYGHGFLHDSLYEHCSRDHSSACHKEMGIFPCKCYYAAGDCKGSLDDVGHRWPDSTSRSAVFQTLAVGGMAPILPECQPAVVLKRREQDVWCQRRAHRKSGQVYRTARLFLLPAIGAGKGSSRHLRQRFHGAFAGKKCEICGRR